MKRLYEKVLYLFKKNAKNIIDFEKKKMLQLTKKDLKSHQDAKVCYICGSLKFNVPNEISVSFS